MCNYPVIIFLRTIFLQLSATQEEKNSKSSWGTTKQSIELKKASVTLTRNRSLFGEHAQKTYVPLRGLERIYTHGPLPFPNTLQLYQPNMC